MKKIIRYKIIPELKLIIEFAQGDVFVEDSIGLKKEEVADSLYDASYNFIVVAVNAVMNFTDKQVEDYIDYVKSNESVLGKRKSAIITSTPDQVVVYTIYDITSQMLPMNFKIVSSLEAAMNWTNIAKEYQKQIQEVIDDLGR